ncbi:MAG: hypothetical protein ABIQ95_04710, partial [Bdellovibrionia bacterium]
MFKHLFALFNFKNHGSRFLSFLSLGATSLIFIVGIASANDSFDEFLRECEAILSQKSYQTVYLPQAELTLSSSAQTIEDIEAEKTRNHFEHSVNKSAETFKDRSKAVGKFLFFDGAGVRYFGKYLGQGIDFLSKKIKVCLPNRVDGNEPTPTPACIWLEDLLPVNNSELVAFRGVTGGMMVLLGLTSIYTTLDNLVLVPVYYHLTESAVEIICHRYEPNLNRIEKRNSLLSELIASDRVQSPRLLEIRKKIAENTGNLVGEVHHSFDFINAAGLAYIPAEFDEVFHSISICMGLSSMVRGQKKLYECYKGPEKHKEETLIFEKAFKEIVEQSVSHRRQEIQTLIYKGQDLLHSTGIFLYSKRILIESRLELLNHAMNWLNQFEARATQKISDRISGIEQQLLLKEKRLSLQERVYGWFGQGT